MNSVVKEFAEKRLRDVSFILNSRVYFAVSYCLGQKEVSKNINRIFGEYTRKELISEKWNKGEWIAYNIKSTNVQGKIGIFNPQKRVLHKNS